MFPHADWDRPICLMVDEIQNLDPREGKTLESLHLAVDGLPIVPVLAGLSSSQAALTKHGGISRLSRGAVRTLDCLEEGQAAEAMQRMLACFRIETEKADAERWSVLLERISDRWPQHLQNAMQALGEGLLEFGGVLAKVDRGAVIGRARASRLEAYKQRRSPEMRGAVILVGHVMAAVRDGGLHRHQVVDTIRARIRDRPEGSSARRLPKGISPEDFLEHLIPTIIDWNLCRLPPTNPSPACGGGRVGGRFRASGSGRRSPAKAPVTPRGPPPTPPAEREGSTTKRPQHESCIAHLGIIHRGALQEGEDDRLVCPIPSFRTFLIGEAVRTIFTEWGDFMLEGVGEHSATEHDIRLLDELAREPEALDPRDGRAQQGP